MPSPPYGDSLAMEEMLREAAGSVRMSSLEMLVVAPVFSWAANFDVGEATTTTSWRNSVDSLIFALML